MGEQSAKGEQGPPGPTGAAGPKGDPGVGAAAPAATAGLHVVRQDSCAGASGCNVACGEGHIFPAYVLRSFLVPCLR